MVVARRGGGARLHREPHPHLRALAAVREGAPVVGRREDRQEAEVGLGGEHPDDGVDPVVDAQRAPQDLRIPPEGPLPEALADQHAVGAARRRVLPGEGAAEERPDPQSGGEPFGHREGRETGRLALLRGEARLAGDEAGQRLEAPAPLPEVDEVGHRGGLAQGPAVPVRLPDHRQPLGVGEGKGAEEDGVHHAEDGGVRPDPEREGGDRREGEAGVPSVGTQGEARVLPQLVPPLRAAPGALPRLVRPAEGAPGLVQVAELATGPPARLGDRVPSAHQLLDAHVQVEADLLLHLGADLLARAPGEAEEAAERGAAHRASPGAGSSTLKTAST